MKTDAARLVTKDKTLTDAKLGALSQGTVRDVSTETPLMSLAQPDLSGRQLCFEFQYSKTVLI